MAIRRYGALGWFNQMVGSEDQMGRYLDDSLQLTFRERQSVRPLPKNFAGAQIQAAIKLHCKRDDQKGGDFQPVNAVYKQTTYFACLENVREENAQRGRVVQQNQRRLPNRGCGRNKKLSILWLRPQHLQRLSAFHGLQHQNP